MIIIIQSSTERHNVQYGITLISSVTEKMCIFQTMGVDNFFVVGGGGGGGGGACVATPNFVTTPTYYWIATVAVVYVL